MRAIPPRNIQRFELARSGLERTMEALRIPGRDGLESVAFLAGHATSPRSVVIDCFIMPRQVPLKSFFSVSVTVTRDEIANVGVFLEAKQRFLFATIHTHPSSAYHSDTDDDAPLLRFDGALSIVLPDFASAPAGRLEHAAMYRHDGGWKEVSEEDRPALIGFVDAENEFHER